MKGAGPEGTRAGGPGNHPRDKRTGGGGLPAKAPPQGTEDACGARPPSEGVETEDLRRRAGRGDVRRGGTGAADRGVARAGPRAAPASGTTPAGIEERPDDRRGFLTANPS